MFNVLSAGVATDEGHIYSLCEFLRKCNSLKKKIFFSRLTLSTRVLYVSYTINVDSMQMNRKKKEGSEFMCKIVEYIYIRLKSLVARDL